MSKCGPKKGYKQTPEHIAKRKRCGPEHYAWKGDDVSRKGGWSRAERAFASDGVCAECHEAGSVIDRHHLDDNSFNNEPENVRLLCRKCHMAADGRLEEVRARAKRQQPRACAARWA